jgi:O-antigen ligase
MNTVARRDSPDEYLFLRVWIAPILFALLIAAAIRLHSYSPMETMARMVGHLLTVGTVALAILMASGQRFTVSRHTAWLLLALAVSSAISVLGSGNWDLSLQRLELYLAMALLALVFYLLHRDAASLPLENYFLGIALIHLPFLIEAIVSIKLQNGPPFWQLFGIQLAHFANVRQFAECSFFAAVSATGLGLLSRRMTLYSLLLATAAMFGIVMTGSRGAALSWLIFVVLACCFSKAKLRAAAHGVLVLTLAVTLVWYLDHSGLLRSPNLFTRFAVQPLGGENFDSARFTVWRLSLQQIIAHPLFGSGPEGFYLSGCCITTGVLQAHNFVLQFLMEFGVIGCIIATLFFVRAIKALGGGATVATLALATPANRILACLLVAFLGYASIDQMLYHLLPLLQFALFAGLFAAGLVQAQRLSLSHPGA